MYRHSVVRSDGIFVPNTLIDLVNGEDTTLVFNQKQQNTVLNGDGIRATLKIRESSSIPIIILSAKSEDTDKILGLNIGAILDIIYPPCCPE